MTNKQVTTFAVVWIEIVCPAGVSAYVTVTTFAVVWIEIGLTLRLYIVTSVTTFAVVWIEIYLPFIRGISTSHHLRGGVD